MPDAPLDPQVAYRRATEQLTGAILRLDEHVQALTAPTMAASLGRQQAGASSLVSMSLGGENLKFTSVAAGPTQEWKPGQVGESASAQAAQQQLASGQTPGGLGRFDSMPPSGRRSIYDEGIPGSQGRQGGRYGSLPPNAGGLFSGMSAGQTEEMETEDIRIPQFGDWRIDALLKLAAQYTGKAAIKKYQSQTTKEEAEGKEPMSGEEFRQGDFEGSRWARITSGLHKAAGAAVPVSAAYERLGRPLLGLGKGAVEAGRELGYSPQGGIGPAYIGGIFNPLSALTSPAGEQGFREKWGAIELSRFGTGISEQQAKELYGGIAAEGYGGGQQESFAQALAPSVKEGLPPGVAADFVNAVRYGVNGLKELTGITEGLGKVAKSTHMTMTQVAEDMASFAKEQEGHGVLQIEGLRTAKGLMAATGLPATSISALNQSPVGLAVGASKGLLPGQVGALNQVGQLGLMAQTLKTYESMVPQQAAIRNEKGEIIEEPQEAREARMRELGLPANMTPAMIEHIHALERKDPNLEKTQKFSSSVRMFEKKALAPEEEQVRKNKAAIEKKREQIAGEHGGAWGTAEHLVHGIPVLGGAAEAAQGLIAGGLRDVFGGYTPEEELHKLEHPGLTGPQKKTAEKAWQEMKREAEPLVESDVIKRAEKAPLGQRGKILQEGLAGEAESEIEGGEPNKIEMTATTKQFFKLVTGEEKLGNEARAGGKPANSNSNSPLQTDPKLAAMYKKAQQVAAE
jgi:hypothetical protein